MLALLLAAVSLGLSNFAAAVGIGITGASARTRVKVGLIFGAFEAGMPIAGLALGHGLARALGGAAHWISAALLIATGAWALVQAIRAGPGDAGPGDAGPGNAGPGDAAAGGEGTGRLLVTGLALSIDNLAVGFALGAFRVSLAAAIAIIGSVSIALSLAGLELGSRIGRRAGTRAGTRAGRRGAVLGGLVLIAVGIAIAAGFI